MLIGMPSKTCAADSDLSFDDARGVEFTLLAVRLGGMVLSEAMPCYQTDEGTLVPLGALSELLGLSIQVDPVRGVAEGFFIREGRRFMLDTRAQRVRVEGRERTFDALRVRLARQDILVETGLLATWLPIDLAVEPYEGLLRNASGRTGSASARGRPPGRSPRRRAPCGTCRSPTRRSRSPPRRRARPEIGCRRSTPRTW
jgi:hypothetical protein